jgi:hypothetical protein
MPEHVHDWRPYATPYGFYFQGASLAVCQGCGEPWPSAELDRPGLDLAVEGVRRWLNVRGPSVWEESHALPNPR